MMRRTTSRSTSVEGPLPDNRIEVPQTVMRSAGRPLRNLKHPSKL